MRTGSSCRAEVLFEGVRGGNESLAVQRALGEWLTPGDERFFEALDRANAIRNAILQAEVVAYEIDADANDDNVIEISRGSTSRACACAPAIWRRRGSPAR